MKFKKIISLCFIVIGFSALGVARELPEGSFEASPLGNVAAHAVVALSIDGEHRYEKEGQVFLKNLVSTGADVEAIDLVEEEGALRFDGVKSYINTGVTFSSDHKTWCFRARSPAPHHWDVIPFGVMSETQRLYLGFPPPKDRIAMGVGTVLYYGDNNVPYTLDEEWHHYAIVKEEKSFKLYVDAVEVQSIAIETDPGDVTYYLGCINKSYLDNLVIHFFTGQIDDFIISNERFSQEQLKELSELEENGTSFQSLF